MMFMNSFLVLLMHFLCWWSSSWSIMIMMFMNLSLSVANAFPMLIIFLMVDRDYDAHDLLSWCYWYTFCVDLPFMIDGDHDDSELLSWCYWRIRFIWIWSSPYHLSPPCIVKRCSLATMCMNICILSIADFVISLVFCQVVNNVLLIFVIIYPKYGFAHKLAWTF